MNRERLNAAIERSGLSREDIQRMSRDEIVRYFSPENYRHMFGAVEMMRISDSDLDEICEYALEINGGV